MRRAAAGLQPGNEIHQRRQAGDRAVCHGPVNPRQVLEDLTPGTEAHMADLGVAHLARGQANRLARGLEQRRRTGAHEPVPDRGRAAGDGVVGALLALAPSIEYAQDDRAGWLAHGRSRGRGTGIHPAPPLYRPSA